MRKLNDKAEWQYFGTNGLIMILLLLSASGFAITAHAQSGDVTTIAKFISAGRGISKDVQGQSWLNLQDILPVQGFPALFLHSGQ